MEISEVAESRRAESSESGGARTFKRRRESASDVDLWGSSPSSCFVPDSKKRILFPHTPPNARSVVSVLLPNNTKLTLSSGLASQVNSLEDFVNCIQTKAEKVFEDVPTKRKRLVRWEKVFLEDWHGHRIASVDALKGRLKKPNVTILVQDGDSDTKHCHELNITPEPKMLGRLPQGYNVETALADEVAVWDVKGRRRLISVEVRSEKISIFDTGLGMDAESIIFWGKPGGSMHRDVHMKAIGGKPPFLQPYLGKYGAGGVAAALHLGSFVSVSSKSKDSKKVVTLDLSKDDLDKRWQTNQDHWLTPGQFRDMTVDEKKRASGGSFTLVEISKLKRQYTDLNKEIFKTRCLLADIFYYYIQSEEFGVANRDLKYPIEFEVNGLNLAEVQNCETATLLQHRCNGAPFVVDLAFTGPIEDPDDAERIRSRNKAIAHARLTCHYFPNVKGKEKLDAVIEELALLGLCKKTFDDFPRVIVRWLGRLLPENGWDSLPFMKVVGRKEGWKDHWAKRVRATIELDAGFHPTQSKTQLERDQPFTVALQNLGDSSEMKKSSAADVDVVIKRAGTVITSKEFVDQYLSWVKAMHEEYDEEVEFLDSSPTYICDQPNIHELLGLTKDRHHEYAIVFYKHMRDSQGEWEVSDLTPLRVKIPKAVSHTPSDTFATIEWFYCQGSGGEDHGEVKMVVRPIDVPDGQGSKMKNLKNGKLAFSLKKSKALSWTVPKTSKLQRLSPQEWLKKQEDLSNKAPSHIEVLNDTDSKALNCDKTLPTKLTAGAGLPEFLVVVRPKKGFGASFKQQMVYPKFLEMKLKVYLSKNGKQGSLPDEPIWVGCVRGCERNNLKGLYIFDTKGLKFVKQGTYNLCFELTAKEFQVRSCVWSIRVDPSLESKGWRVSVKQNSPLTIRLNEQLGEELLFTKLDIYDNLQFISRHLKIEVSLQTSDDIGVLPRIPCNSEKLELSSDMRILTLKKALLFREGNINQLGPGYEGCLVFHFQESEGRGMAEDNTAILKCRVYPGQMASMSVMQGPSLLTGPPISIAHQLRPNDIIDTFCFQAKDASGNAVMKGQRVGIQLHNLQFRDRIGPFRELAEQGILDLGGLLTVIGPYNSKGSICIFCEDQHEKKRNLVEILVTVATCRLQIGKPVRRTFRGGSSLEGVLVEFLGEDGLLDTTIDGPLHSLTVGWMKNVTCPVIKGQCQLPSFSLPSKYGPWCGQIYHTTYKNLKVDLQLNLELGIASRLVLPADYHVISVRNDESFMLNFSALDDQGQPAMVTPDMVENMVVEVDPIHCSVMSFKISATDASLTSFNTSVQLGGMVGSYAVVLRALPNAYPTLSLDEQPGSNALLAWKVNLKPGKLVQLHYQIHEAEAWPENLDFIEVPRDSFFPATKIHLIDGYRNTCLLHDNQVLNLILEKQGVGKGTSICQKCQIKNGHGMFEPFEMEAPEGNYEMSISSASRPPLPVEPRFNLKVTRGENALTLCLTDDKPIQVKLQADVKLLKNLTLDVASVNDRPLKLSTTPVLELLASDQPSPSCSQKFVGQEVTSSDQAPSHSKRFQFPPFSVPTIAGKYLLKFSLPDYDIPSCFRDLEVECADPFKLELSTTQTKYEGLVARASISDMYGNTCEEVSDLIVKLELRISNEEFSSASANAVIRRSYYLMSKEEAVVKSGVAAFERIQISKGGRPGKYDLRVVVEQDQKMARHLGHLKPSELSMSVTDEAQELQLQESLQTCQENVKTQRDGMIKLKRQMEAARDESHRENATLAKLLLSQATQNNNKNNNSNAENNFSAQDEQILSRERARRIRSEHDVMQDLDRLARRGHCTAAAALAFLQAREAGKFLAPNGPLAGEAIGLLVTLARVENEDFNKILCEYLNPSTLMLPICMTQDGVDALEIRRGGVVDTSCGLASVSQYPLTSNYETISLADLRPWTAYGDPSHPQLLLKIPPPRLSGTTDEVPRGFLGYAVNLLHIKPEHLKINVTVTSMHTRTFNLRETLFYHLLKTMQVYDTRENIMRAKKFNALSGGGMSLDGCLIKPNMRQQLGMRDRRDSSISFAMVPFEERMNTCGLFPPACHAFKRYQSQQLIQRQMEAQERQIQEVRATCDQKRHAFERLSKQLSDAGEALRLAELKEREVRKQQSSLKKNINSNELLYTVR